MGRARRRTDGRADLQVGTALAAISCGMMISATRVGAIDRATDPECKPSVSNNRQSSSRNSRRMSFPVTAWPGARPARRRRVVGGLWRRVPPPAALPSRRDPAESCCTSRRNQQADLVPHASENRQSCLAVGAKRRQYSATGLRSISPGRPAGELTVAVMRGRREHHRRNPRRPAPIRPRSLPLPHVDDRLPVEIHRSAPAANRRPGSMLAGSSKNDARKAWVRHKHRRPRSGSVDGTKPRGDRRVNHHTVELTWISQRPSASTDLFTIR